MNCPLCNKHLLDISVGSGPREYICQTRIKFAGKATLPHYEVREGQAYWYLPPDYQILTSENETTVMKIADSQSYPNAFYGKPDFKKVFTMNEHFSPTEPEKLIKRIKLLTLFS